jgi:ATP-dependent Clp protease ATP-binding subunit ClpX
MAMEGFELRFSGAALRELAHRAVAKGTGARGLRTMLEAVMLDVMYDAPDRSGGGVCRVTKALVASRIDRKPQVRTPLPHCA